jgi:hypothetical protein
MNRRRLGLIGRLLLVTLLFPGLPGLTLLTLQTVGAKIWAVLLGIVAGFIVWGWLARRLLVLYRSRCPACQQRSVQTETHERRIVFVCEACGWREDAEVEWFD